MRRRIGPWFQVVGAALLAITPAPTWAGEPSVGELVALAPVLDSSSPRCRSLDIGGTFGSEKGPGPKLRFRAVYRAPDHFAMLVSDLKDGTPLAYCSGRKMLVYDPVDPTFYYSEDASFNLEAAATDKKFRCKYFLRLNKGKDPNHLLVDFASTLAGFSSREGYIVADHVASRGAGKFAWSRTDDKQVCLTLGVDLAKECPYTSAVFSSEGETAMCFDRLVLNGEIGDELFAFPTRERLERVLPIKDKTAREGKAATIDTLMLVGRGSVVRCALGQAERPETMRIPGLSGVNWDRVRENDKRYAVTLRDLVPLSLRAK